MLPRIITNFNDDTDIGLSTPACDNSKVSSPCRRNIAIARFIETAQRLVPIGPPGSCLLATQLLRHAPVQTGHQGIGTVDRETSHINILSKALHRRSLIWVTYVTSNMWHNTHAKGRASDFWCVGRPLPTLQDLRVSGNRSRSTLGDACRGIGPGLRASDKSFDFAGERAISIIHETCKYAATPVQSLLHRLSFGDMHSRTGGTAVLPAMTLVN